MSLIFCLISCCLWWHSSAHYSSFTSMVGMGEPCIPVVATRFSIMPPEEKLITQKLDHFNSTDNRTWTQRFQVNSNFHRTGGPAFLLLGGEERISKTWMDYGAVVEYAKKMNAKLFQLEHRYYGESHPTKNSNTSNLKYLNTKQALADVKAFIKSENKGALKNAKWVVFGGSYSGSLAAWARMIYPHLIHAAVSSSGTVKTKLDNKEYFRVATNALSDYNPKCVSNIREATTMIADHLKTENGTKYIRSQFKICFPINTNVKKDVRSMFHQLSSSVAGIIQYNKDNRYYLGKKQSDFSIVSLCDVMLNKSLGNSLDRYIVLHEKLRTNFNKKCSSYPYQSLLTSNSEINWDKGYVKSGDRQWYYQLCTEIGNFVTSNEDDHLFGDTIPLEFFTDMCTDIFGEAFNLNTLENEVEKTTKKYHDLRKKTSRVFYVHGSIDPWNGLGLIEPKSENSESIVIEGVSHCADLYPSLVTDPPQLTKARETISQHLEKWLDESNIL